MESTIDRDGSSCLRNRQFQHRSGFARLPHRQNLSSIVIGATSRKVSGNLGDINLVQDTSHSQFSDHLNTTGFEALPDIQACPERSRSGAGQVRNLREAATLSPALAQLLTDFAAAERAGQQALLDTVLKAWSDTSTMAGTFTSAYAGHSLSVNIRNVAAGSAVKFKNWRLAA
ncbi:hypothetical protein [Methylomonas koyamae]|uniref:Uncharacterized protein n=1 Tax=Methylomonas koyamae TaxID=702114 RepID=A0AA91DCQ3_9GAMM|nr:hypothetical protein [Methylomonas koyamae]OAI26389.1 hypothetical protein A1356_11280 [Methylomonas koyamae]